MADTQYPVHTSISAVSLNLPLGQRLVTKKFNQTAAQQGMERAVFIPSECLSAPEVPDAFRPLVEAALMQAAVSALTKWVKQGNTENYSIPAELFHRPALVEEFMGQESWMDKSQLDAAFTASATWSRITGRPEWKSSPVYRKKAEYIKEHLLKLSGKRVSIKPELCDQLISIIDEKDLSTEFGVFVLKRLQQIRDRVAEEGEIDIGGM